MIITKVINKILFLNNNKNKLNIDIMYILLILFK